MWKLPVCCAGRDACPEVGQADEHVNIGQHIRVGALHLLALRGFENCECHVLFVRLSRIVASAGIF